MMGGRIWLLMRAWGMCLEEFDNTVVEIKLVPLAWNNKK